MHWLVYLSFPVALIHAIGVGTDLKFTWMQVVTGACVAAVLVAAAWRLWASPRQAGVSTARPRHRRGSSGEPMPGAHAPKRLASSAPTKGATPGRAAARERAAAGERRRVG